MQYEVTIGIPVYKAAGYIEKTIQSAIAQIFPDIEYLVIDDGSIDGSIDIVKRLQTTVNSSTGQVRDEQGIGGSYSREPGRAPYIIRISGDSMVEADIPDGAQVLVNPILEANDGDTIIAESCEYCNSFLSFYPTVAVINNIEAEHLDFFKDLNEIKATFRKFAEMVPADGFLIANGDDETVMDTLKGLPYRTFGLGEGNMIHPINVSQDWKHCTVICDGKKYCDLSIPNYGKFNLMNAIGACAVSWCMGIDGETAARGIAGYQSVGRRQQLKGHCNGADVYDDYAHHPSEVKALIEGMRTMGYKRIVTAYQPFTFSRAATLFDKFVDALSTADVTVMCEIHPARETNTYGISSKDIAAKIPGCVYFDTVPEVAEYLRSIARPGDAILTTGGGPIVKAGEAICEPES